MKKILILAALLAPSVAFAQDLEQQAAQASTSPLAAWSSVLSPQMAQAQSGIQQPKEVPCAFVTGVQPKKGEDISFETDVNKCFVPKPDQPQVGLKDAEQVDPKGKRGEIVAPVK